MTDEGSVLEGDDAIALWKQGREAWNRWVDANPVSDVRFEEVNFTEHTSDGTEISFSGYNFPAGCVSFRDAVFGNGDVSFHEADFGDGPVSFIRAKFGDGGVDFQGALFGHGAVDFKFTSFGAGYVSFEDVHFGTGHVDFSGAKFENGYVIFQYAIFDSVDVVFDGSKFVDCYVSFENAVFRSGYIRFSRVDFSNSDVSFWKTQFGDGDVNFDQSVFGGGDFLFDEVTFGDCDLFFTNVRFGEGDVSFSDLTFGAGDISFAGATSGGNFFLSALNGYGTKRLKSVSFRRCRFDGIVILDGTFTCTPDLRSTITQGHVDLQNLRVEPWTLDWSWPWIGFSKDPDNDVPALRRLKELAEANRHHDAALRFFADERRAMRWNEGHLSKPASLMEWAYDWLCRYGQSVGRPAIWLGSALILFATVYALESPAPLSLSVKVLEAVYASTSNILPFIPAAFDIRRTAFDELYPCGIPPLIDGLRLLQGLLGFLFLFLIGLGLRNRFRM